MDRAFLTLGLFAVTAFAAGACDGPGGAPAGGGAAWGPTGRSFGGCRQYTSCEVCTPVEGCGWCYRDDGSGMCADDPNDCSSASVFTWTWDPGGCFVPPDAAVVPIDAGADALAPDANAQDAGLPRSGDASDGGAAGPQAM
ncbi:MAG TPA: hypothetical protein VE987_22140 [Polyangiaceae bacterium]|nr:hypothetical protein [Polyangiaceae bacterium]